MLEFRNHALPDFRLHFRDLCPIIRIPGQIRMVVEQTA
jgi:hypothetical protein